MPKKPLKKLKKVPEIEDWKIKILETGEYPEGEGFEGLHFFYSGIQKNSPDLRLELYQTIKKDFLSAWIKDHPGSRPWGWWEFDCPRQKDKDANCFWHGTLPEERQHISGGTRCKYNFVPSYRKAVFKYWHYTDDDVPMFESEAAFLKRLDLLTGDERRHLEKHPELLEPESLLDAIPGAQSK